LKYYRGAGSASGFWKNVGTEETVADYYRFPDTMPIQQIREIIRKDIRRQLAFSTKKYRKYVLGPRGGKLPEFFRKKGKGNRWKYYSRDMDGTVRPSLKKTWLTKRYGLYNQTINLETPVKVSKSDYDRVLNMTPEQFDRHTTVSKSRRYEKQPSGKYDWMTGQ